ncbi:MAG: arylamine N-acetyltransferase family protein [Micromonosporaceae bacterium]
MIDIDRYLANIGYRGTRRPDLTALHLIHRAHLARVPHENIDVHLDVPMLLDSEWILDKLVTRRRGGSCFELNGALQLLLAELGFDVQMLEAGSNRVEDGDDAWGNHLTLLVHLDGEPWLVDVGLGDGWLWPLPLREGVHRQGPIGYRIEQLDDATWRVHRRPGFQLRSTDIRLGPQKLTDHLDRHLWYQTSPESVFSRALVVRQPREDHVLMLRDLVLTCRGPAVDGGVERRTLASRDEFEHVLTSEFNVAIDDLGAAGASRLWQRVNENHEAWLAEKAKRKESETPFAM